MVRNLLQKTCRDLAMFSDSLTITVTKAGIVFNGKGDTGSSVVNYPPTKNVDDDDNEVNLCAYFYIRLNCLKLEIRQLF